MRTRETSRSWPRWFGQGRTQLPLWFCLQLALVSLVRGGPPVSLALEEPAGVGRVGEHVTSGVPFPMGALKSDRQLRLVDERGQAVALQAAATATWRDGSVKWALLDFAADVPAHGRRDFTLEHGEGVGALPSPKGIAIAQRNEEVEIDTGPLRVVLSRREPRLVKQVFRDANGDGRCGEDEALLREGLELALKPGGSNAAARWRVLPAADITVEESGPLRAAVKVSGWIDDGGSNRLFRYDTRLHAFAGVSRLKLLVTLTQMSDRDKRLAVGDWSLVVQPRASFTRAVLGGEPEAHSVGGLEGGASACLTQLREGKYDLGQSGVTVGGGFRAPGWIDISGPTSSLYAACRHFWQQFPKAIRVEAGRAQIGLYPAEAGQSFDWDQGLAKTHEIWLEFHAGTLTATEGAQRATALDQPLFAIAPPAWYCDSRVFGELLPYDFDLFPEYETLTEASGDQFLRRMVPGFRHWGDVYYGGEYKGTNSFTNLEYDMHHNFLCQFARTGLRKYLDPALTMARHQADIDTNHKTGWQWKHSPRHVEIQAEFGHTFTRGLIEAGHLWGDRRCREAAVELGEHFAREIGNPRSTGNERQIGWALISLLPVFEDTWNPRYFEAASNTVERLMGGLDARGRFNIRWDNRIAFFNGIAATGFLYYHRATGDERVADAALRVIRRARGFYPEYNGRTLEAIAWACDRAAEPEWPDFLARTWETTLARQIEWNVMELGAPTIFTVHALPLLRRTGLLAQPEHPLRLTAAQADTARGLHLRHLPASEADLFLEIDSTEPFDLVVIRKGAWKNAGQAALSDPQGRGIASLEFAREPAVWQRRSIRVLPRDAGAWRLALRAPLAANARKGSSVTWDVATSRPLRGVFMTPDFRGMEFVTPRLYSMPRGDARRIELETAAEGEGFKRLVIYSPDGQVAGSVESFIDLGDRGRYFHKLSAPIPEDQADRTWSISLEGMTLEKMTGLSPYFSTSPRSYFQPDRPGRPPLGSFPTQIPGKR